MEESTHTQSSTLSRSNSRTSSELEKEIAELDIVGGGGGGSGSIGGSSGGGSITGNGSATGNGTLNKSNTIKKRISSSRTPTIKARRVRFYRNGDRFYAGIVIAVSNERYR